MEKLQVIKHPQFGQLSVIIVNGKEMFKAKDCAIMLGYKDTINAIKQHCKGVVKHHLPTKGGIQEVSLIPEGDVWRLIIRSKLPQAVKIEKWIMDEVLPAVRKTGTYTMKHEPKTDKPYEYFDKTYNGISVLTTADVEYLTKIHRATVDWNLRTKLVKGKDYYYIFGDELKKYKRENPRVSKLSSVMYLITREGFIKLCRTYGIKVEEPKCFEAKEEPQKSVVHRIFDEFKKYYDIERYALTNENAKALDVGKNGLVNESCLIMRSDNGKYQMFADKTAPLLEKQFMVAQNLGRILSGQLREGANPDINYGQDARTFAMVVMAMSLYFGN